MLISIFIQKAMISPSFFFVCLFSFVFFLFVFFHFFRIFIFWVVMTKTGPKWEKLISVAPHISGTIRHIILIYSAHAKLIIFPGLFYFIKNLVFQVVRWGKGGKGQITVQTQKKICLWHLISQEPYIIWLSFVVHNCKLMISWGYFFHFFKVLIFWLLVG